MSQDDRTEEQKRLDALELLQANHEFPCAFMFKVIGSSELDLVAEVISALSKCQANPQDVECRTRSTPNGKHLSVTLEPQVASAEEVLQIYAEFQAINGVVMVM